MMKFSENLVKFRKMRGLTQEEIAEKIQVSRQSVSKWENGESVPELTKIMKIADILNVSIDEICGRSEKREGNRNNEVTSDAKNKRKINSIIYFVMIIIISVVCSICGYFIGHSQRSDTEKTIEVYQIPDNIKVSGISLDIQRGVLTCEFVPSVYSDELTYCFILSNYNMSDKKSSNVEFEDGIGKVSMPVRQDFYKAILQIKNEVESRNIVLVEKMYINIKEDTVYIHE